MKPMHLRRFLDQMPAFVVDRGCLAFVMRLDLHQHVAGKELALAAALLAAAHLDHFLGRHQHVAELLFHAGARDALFQRARHLILEARIGVHDVPALAHAHRLSVPASAAGPERPTSGSQSIRPSSRLQDDHHDDDDQVVRIVSSRVGHTTLRSSNCDSATEIRAIARPGA